MGDMFHANVLDVDQKLVECEYDWSSGSEDDSSKNVDEYLGISSTRHSSKKRQHLSRLDRIQKYVAPTPERRILQLETSISYINRCVPCVKMNMNRSILSLTSRCIFY